MGGGGEIEGKEAQGKKRIANQALRPLKGFDVYSECERKSLVEQSGC